MVGSLWGLRKEIQLELLWSSGNGEGILARNGKGVWNCSWASSYEWGCYCVSQEKFLKYNIPFLRKREKCIQIFCRAYFFSLTSENKQSKRALPLWWACLEILSSKSSFCELSWSLYQRVWDSFVCALERKQNSGVSPFVSVLTTQMPKGHLID